MLARYRDIATAGVKGKEGDEKEATKELYSTLHKAIGDRMSAMAPEDLLGGFSPTTSSPQASLARSSGFRKKP
jgi:hypothetical protein